MEKCRNSSSYALRGSGVQKEVNSESESESEEWWGKWRNWKMQTCRNQNIKKWGKTGGGRV
jgi:hypothetical protein